MKLDPNKEYYDQDFGWVAHPNGAGTEEERALSDKRFDLEILGGIQDKEASYSYDDWALCKLGSKYYLLSTSGCSCPSPTETWRIEIGPASLTAIRKHVTSGAYEGYTVPGKQMDEFIALLDSAKESAKKVKGKNK